MAMSQARTSPASPDSSQSKVASRGSQPSTGSATHTSSAQAPATQGSPGSHGAPSATTSTQPPLASSHTPSTHTALSSAQVGAAPGWQAAPRQVSTPLQTKPSSQLAPSGEGAGTVHDPVAGSQASPSQGGPAVEQSTGSPLAQAPAWQLSPAVQRSPSSQGPLSLIAATLHCPLAGLQKPKLHVVVPAEQSFGTPPLHSPPVQASPLVHAFRSSHGSPSAVGTGWHSPVASWHWPTRQGGMSKAEQSTEPPTHSPPAQAKVPQVSGLPHGTPSFSATTMQPPSAGSHTPAAQGPSRLEQSSGAPAQPAPPALQVSPAVQGSPSSQAAPGRAGTPTHAPVVPTHTPRVHPSADPAALQSLSTGTHRPAWQLAEAAQGLPGSQVVPSGAALSLHAPVAASQGRDLARARC
jgi:hypothetical protein